jgi:hypothetical protein
MMVNYETDARYGLVENKLQSKFEKESNICKPDKRQNCFIFTFAHSFPVEYEFASFQTLI